MVMTLGQPHEAVPGLWTVLVHPGHADTLLAALDVTVPYVMIDCGDPSRGWHDAPVRIGKEPAPVVRRVKTLSFTVLVSTTEAGKLGGQMRDEHDGQLYAVQLTHEPKSDFQLPTHSHGLAAAMAGLGVHLIIDCPHGGEETLISATTKSALRDFMNRFYASADQ